MRPSINKKCVMKVRGQRTGWCGAGKEGRGEEGARRAGGGQALFLFSEIGILSFTAELMGPDIELK